MKDIAACEINCVEHAVGNAVKCSPVPAPRVALWATIFDEMRFTFIHGWIRNRDGAGKPSSVIVVAERTRAYEFTRGSYSKLGSCIPP
jgi:hypothetical protein